VRNLAQRFIGHVYNIYTLDAGRQILPAAADGISQQPEGVVRNT
jgi:hypothetical protein